MTSPSTARRALAKVRPLASAIRQFHHAAFLCTAALTISANAAATDAPVVPPDGFSVHRAALVWANIPPARVWVYRRI